MELYQFSWGSGSDEECYSFFINMDRESIVNLMARFEDYGGDLFDYDDFENYVTECGFEISRYYHEEPTYIQDNEIKRRKP